MINACVSCRWPADLRVGGLPDPGALVERLEDQLNEVRRALMPCRQVDDAIRIGTHDPVIGEIAEQRRLAGSGLTVHLHVQPSTESGRALRPARRAARKGCGRDADEPERAPAWGRCAARGDPARERWPRAVRRPPGRIFRPSAVRQSHRTEPLRALAHRRHRRRLQGHSGVARSSFVRNGIVPGCTVRGRPSSSAVGQTATQSFHAVAYDVPQPVRPPEVLRNPGAPAARQW